MKSLLFFTYLRKFLRKFTAVRKNRYVILPIDFEEAWKVSRFSLFLIQNYNGELSLANGQEK